MCWSFLFFIIHYYQPLRAGDSPFRAKYPCHARVHGGGKKKIERGHRYWFSDPSSIYVSTMILHNRSEIKMPGGPAERDIAECMNLLSR